MFERPAFAGRQLTRQPSQHRFDHVGHRDVTHPYIRRKQGREEVTYAHPLLEPILCATLGVILYQEQIIEIAISVAV